MDKGESLARLVGVGDGDEDVDVAVVPAANAVGFSNELEVEVGHSGYGFIWFYRWVGFDIG